jgi:NAD(P)-dependent dehydrogenase (short-subunit alcohol dehydrogenase family)
MTTLVQPVQGSRHPLATRRDPGHRARPLGNDQSVGYGAAKAALVNLTKSLAQEYGPNGIRVNAVSPGPVASDLWLGRDGVAETVAAATGVDADAARETIIAGLGGFATGRFTTPEEVATLVVLLASRRTANGTGTNAVIDGGLIKTT